MYYFVEKKIYLYINKSKENDIYNTIQTIYKRYKKRLKKKRINRRKKGREVEVATVIHLIEKHNLFKSFSLYTFYVFD